MLYFDGLPLSVSTACPHDEPHDMAACVVTVLEYRQEDLPVLHGVTRVGPHGWYPAFGGPRVVSDAVELLCGGVDEPTIWVVGARYCWGASFPRSDVIPEESPVPAEISDRRWFDEIGMIRLAGLSDIEIPSGQGSQHYSGLRFAVIPRSSVRRDALDTWVAHMNGHGEMAYSLTDTCAPPGVVAWISSFGDEYGNMLLWQRGVWSHHIGMQAS